MNILFVNYGDFTTNSLNHIGGFAAALTHLGHDCAVAVPHGLETLRHVTNPRFHACTFADALAQPALFADGRPADILHAWTPRELVRKFTLAYQRAASQPARVLVHLEDNERFLVARFTGKSFEELCVTPAGELAQLVPENLSHPLRHQAFLAVADGVTLIEPRLGEFVPAETPQHILRPGVDLTLYAPQASDPALRAELGLTPDTRVLAYTGGTTFANAAEVRTLYEAVALLNQRGTPTRLVRTGFNAAGFLDSLRADARRCSIELGFVPKEKLPRLLALADVLVQPGTRGAFNDYRLPSKLPEFLALGKPVLLPASNLALLMRDGRDAVFLHEGTAEEIADRCAALFATPVRCAELGKAARTFAETHFDLTRNTTQLASFYARVHETPPRTHWALLRTPTHSEIDLFAEQLVRSSAPPSSAASGLLLQLIHLLEQELATDLRAQLADAIAERDARRAKEPLTQQHIANLEAELTGSRAHIQNLEQHRRTLDWLLASTRADRDRSAQRAAAAAQRLEAAHRELDHARHELAATRDALDARVRKVAQMQQSFSWRVTAPLRALRRRFIDARQSRHSGFEPPSVAPDFAFAIDEPLDWAQLPVQGRIRGWVLHPPSGRISAIRVRTAENVFTGIYGTERPDVAAAHPGQPDARRSGFSLEYAFPPDTTQLLALEALCADGRWRCLLTTSAHVLSESESLGQRDYATWIRRFDDPAARSTTLRKRLASLTPERRPRISVLMPTYNTPEPWLVRAIESVRAQLYPNWELCIADDASSAPHVRAILEQAARDDTRIKVIFRDTNGHISASSNSALTLATGEFVALLDHDDELAPHALAEVALALSAQPGVEFVYSDEDKIDETGRRFDPYFKPDWNPDLLLGQAYTCHLSVFRTARVRTLGGFREGYEGSQDWDLTLRFTADLNPNQIQHIPRVLYHWRAIGGSTALQTSEKNYVFEAARRALADHCATHRISAELVPVAQQHWRLRRPVPAQPPRVSLLIPTHNAEPLLRLCISSIFAKTTYPNFEIIVVNNRSSDPATLRYFEELRTAGVTVLDHDAPFNFSAINNTAARAASGELLAFLNNDLEVITPDWLDEMVSHAVRPEIGCVGAMLYYPDDTVQHAGIVLGIGGQPGTPSVAGHAFKCAPRGAEGHRNRLRLVQNYSAVTAACLVVRRSVFEQAGGFNETDLAVAFNDVDFCLRVRAAGYRNLWTPFAELYHHESASRGLEDTPEKQTRFAREVAYMRARWGAVLDDDPAYNPNLTAEHEDFSLAFPPRSRVNG